MAHGYLLELQEELGFELLSIDIREDPSLHERYRWDIPVVRVDGVEWARHRIEPELFEGRLLKRIEEARQQRGGADLPQADDDSERVTKRGQ